MKGKSLKDHYYYGQHTTDDLSDGYCGSGVILQKYYNKYGAIENVTYTKTIIDFYSNLTELNQAEYELIGDKYKTDSMCLNLRAGGNKAGFSSESIEKLSISSYNAIQKKIEEGTYIPPMLGKHLSKETKRKIGAIRKGRKHSEETKQKMRENYVGTRGKHWKLDPITKKRVYY